MANYNTLLTTINANIKANGNQEITGPVLNSVLTQMTNELGDGYQFVGVAAEDTAPGTPDQNVFYLATAGTYSNFGGLTVDSGEFAVLKWNGTWSKQTLPLTTFLTIDISLDDLQTSISGSTFTGQFGRTVAEVEKAGLVRYETDGGGYEYYLVCGTDNQGEAPDKVIFINHNAVWVVSVNESDDITGISNYPLAIDATPTENSYNGVQSGGVYTALAAKQDVLTFDDVPTENSNNPVKSGGVYSAVAAVNAKVAAGYIFLGIATPASTPNTSIGKVFYLANAYGTYTNYGGLTIAENETSLLMWDGTAWSKVVVTTATNTKIYGVRHFYTNASPDLVRIGNMDCHRTLPIQSLMRRCLVRDDGTVNYYLDENDSTKKADGTTAVLDGTDGQVMVEIPAHYRKCTLNAADEYMDVESSLYPFEGAVYIPTSYVSAYEATLDRLNLKLSSVVNTTAQYRGGDNNSAWDGTYKDLRGLPATKISLTNFRAYANNRGTGWGCYDYNIHLDIFWLFAIEYATLNSQKTFNATLTADGYRQGGLGLGVSTFSRWNAYNSNFPFIPCGFTNSLGNKTGVVTFTLNAEQAEAYGSEHSESVPSYRGIENPFGHIWKWTDGFLGVGNGEYQEVYVCREPDKYSSSVTADYTDIGHESSPNGYCKAIIASDSALDQAIRVYGDIFDRDDSGSASTFYCDCHYHANTDGATYVLRVGGSAYYEFLGGLACLSAESAPSYTSVNMGSRLCYTKVN